MSIASVISEGFIHDRVNGLIDEGFATYTGLPEPPPAGYTYAAYAGGGSGQWLGAGASPAVVIGDVFGVTITSPSGYSVLVNSDGTVNILAGGDSSRQSFQYIVYRVAGNSLDGPAIVWVNEAAPIWGTVIFLDNQTIGNAISPINLAGAPYASSPSGDVLTFSIGSGLLPPGLTLSNAGVISGTPGFAGTFNFTVIATDITGTGSPSPAGQIIVQDISANVDLHDSGTQVVRESHYNRKKREKILAAKAAKQRNGRTPEQIAADETVLAQYLEAEQQHIERLTQIAVTLINSLRIH